MCTACNGIEEAEGRSPVESLSDDDKALFAKAKAKEVQAWIDHGTVKKLTKGHLPAHRVMRSRWILSWKPPLPGTTEKRAKARLVVLGFEDPDISSVPNDAPTLSKDAKQMILQKVASNRWDLINLAQLFSKVPEMGEYWVYKHLLS